MVMGLLEWRTKEGMSQIKAAEYFGIPNTTLCRMERGRGVAKMHKPRMMHIFNMTFGEVTPNDLYGITPDVIKEAKKRRQK